MFTIKQLPQWTNVVCLNATPFHWLHLARPHGYHVLNIMSAARSLDYDFTISYVQLLSNGVYLFV